MPENTQNQAINLAALACWAEGVYIAVGDADDYVASTVPMNILEEAAAGLLANGTAMARLERSEVEDVGFQGVGFKVKRLGFVLRVEGSRLKMETLGVGGHAWKGLLEPCTPISCSQTHVHPCSSLKSPSVPRRA